MDKEVEIEMSRKEFEALEELFSRSSKFDIVWNKEGKSDSYDYIYDILSRLYSNAGFKETTVAVVELEDFLENVGCNVINYKTHLTVDMKDGNVVIDRWHDRCEDYYGIWPKSSKHSEMLINPEYREADEIIEADTELILATIKPEDLCKIINNDIGFWRPDGIENINIDAKGNVTFDFND